MDNSLESLLAEEAGLRLPSFSNEAAWRLGNILVRRARAEDLAIAVGIIRGGQRLFWFAAEGTSPDNDRWLERKLRTALHFGHSSLYIGRRLASLGQSLEEKYALDPAEFSVHGGAFPIVLRGTGLVGAVAVSGLAQEEDHAMVAEALKALARR